MIEHLECRRLLSASGFVQFPSAVEVPGGQSLSTADVQRILAQAISQNSSKTAEVAVVVDREGQVLGALASQAAVDSNGGADLQSLLADATARARTAGFFQSNGEAFTTRTARFIIQNHFPPGIRNAAGGPLFGVEFSSLPGSDILPASLTPAVSGDPGGVPLYIRGKAVGGIGVAGDFHDVAAIQELLPTADDRISNNYTSRANLRGAVYTGIEERDRDEAVALAGARGYMAPASIRANNIFVAGLRLPFVASGAARGRPNLSFQQLLSSGAATEFTPSGAGYIVATTTAIKPGAAEQINARVSGIAGLIRNRANVVMSDIPGVPATDGTGNSIPHADPQQSDAIIAGLPQTPGGAALSQQDVTTIIENAVQRASTIRAGIRKPTGLAAKVHVAVVDSFGHVLGVFRMQDGTNFSYDVAVEKARTAAFFSDDTHAFSTRAVGFMSQRFFPPGITGSGGVVGPLFKLQNNLNPAQVPPFQNLSNGITIFPGGVPLYKDGVFVGAIGVSGDGVDQDDFIAADGARGFEPAASIRSDSLPAANVIDWIVGKVQQIQSAFGLTYDAAGQARKSLVDDLPDLRLPYVKFPRNPFM